MKHAIIPDKTVYKIFKCSKCLQYQYYRDKQKTKKCLRCGESYLVINLKPVDEVIGMSTAVRRVKELQCQISSNSPRFSVPNEYSIISGNSSIYKSQQILYDFEKEEDKYLKALNSLKSASFRFSEFPRYLTYVILGRLNLKPKRIHHILRRAKRENILMEFVKNNTVYFKWSDNP